MASAEAKVGRMLESAGLELNGPNPEDPQVLTNDSGIFGRVLHGGTLAIGEAYMNGEWTSEALDVLVDKITQVDGRSVRHLGLPTLARTATQSLFQNLQTRRRAQQNVARHYDIGNKLYQRMLDPSMAYSCGVWEYGAQTLEEAQKEKYDLICRKMGLEAGMQVLDIGCGWGGMANFAVRNYGVEVVGVTLAEEQFKYIQERGFDFEARFQDYRAIEDETFDRVWSIGMFEHVGPKNYVEYFDKVRELTNPDGMSLLHTIGVSRTQLFTNPWIAKYIFPGGHLPSEAQIRRASSPPFAVADWHDIGPNYDPTLMAWNDNFQASWDELAQYTNPDGSVKYDETFKRMWEYYLLTCAGTFRSGSNHLFQVVLTSPEMADDYEPVRQAA